jgi:hypothetical protein
MPRVPVERAVVNSHLPAEEAAIVKRDWWQIWEQDAPPKCEYIIMSLDAAAEKHKPS